MIACGPWTFETEMCRRFGDVEPVGVSEPGEEIVRIVGQCGEDGPVRRRKIPGRHGCDRVLGRRRNGRRISEPGGSVGQTGKIGEAYGVDSAPAIQERLKGEFVEDDHDDRGIRLAACQRRALRLVRIENSSNRRIFQKESRNDEHGGAKERSETGAQRRSERRREYSSTRGAILLRRGVVPGPTSGSFKANRPKRNTKQPDAGGLDPTSPAQSPSQDVGSCCDCCRNEQNQEGDQERRFRESGVTRDQIFRLLGEEVENRLGYGQTGESPDVQGVFPISGLSLRGNRRNGRPTLEI